jgi:predicted metal-dependent hydrolase
LIAAHRLLGAGRPFHAHEILEDAWKSGPEAERELWRGLAQLAVGITHAARGNGVGGARLIERGARNIAPYQSARPHRLDIAAVIKWCEQAVAEIARQTPVMLRPPPLLLT